MITPASDTAPVATPVTVNSVALVNTRCQASLTAPLLWTTSAPVSAGSKLPAALFTVTALPEATNCASAQTLVTRVASIAYPWVGMNGTQDGQPADTLAILAMSQELLTVTTTAKESDAVRVVYTRERDRLIRFVRKNLYTLTDTNESLDQMELADRVHAFNIRYYDEQNRVWLDEWPSASKLPKAVLLEVTFQYPDAAPWTVREWVTIGTS